MTDPTPTDLAECLDEMMAELVEGYGLGDTPLGFTGSCNLIDAAATELRKLSVERDALTLSRLREYDLRLEITEAERDALKAENERLIRLTTGIDSVRSAWHATEGPVWTSRVIESLRHSGLMEADDD